MVKDQVSHQYKTTAKFIPVWILLRFYIGDGKKEIQTK